MGSKNTVVGEEASSRLGGRNGGHYENMARCFLPKILKDGGPIECCRSLEKCSTGHAPCIAKGGRVGPQHGELGGSVDGIDGPTYDGVDNHLANRIGEHSGW